MLQSNYEQSRETRTPKICYNQNMNNLEKLATRRGNQTMNNLEKLATRRGNQTTVQKATCRD